MKKSLLNGSKSKSSHQPLSTSSKSPSPNKSSNHSHSIDNYPNFRSNQHRSVFTPKFLALLLGGGLIIILLISLIGIILRSPGEITIINESDPNSALLSDQDLARVKKETYEILKNVANADSNYIDVFVRWDTLEQSVNGPTTFLIDVDAYRQTYLVKLDPYQVLLSCPDLNLSKYPDSFCVGNDGEYNDSISVVFGDELPLISKTDQGETFEIVRSEIADGTWNRDLAIWILACSNTPSDSTTSTNIDSSSNPVSSNSNSNSSSSSVSSNSASYDLTSRVSSAVDELISARGASPSVFTKKFYYMPCHGE